MARLGRSARIWMQYRLIKKYFGGADRGADLGDRIRASSRIVSFQARWPHGCYHELHDVGMFDNQKGWLVAAQMGVANYGQMTAGGWMYIGPGKVSYTVRLIPC